MWIYRSTAFPCTLDVLSESGIIAILRDAIPLYNVVSSLQVFLDKDEEPTRSSLEHQMFSLLIRLVKTLYYLCTYLQTKVEQAGPVRPGGSRNKRRVKGNESVPKRNLEALKALCKPLNSELGFTIDDTNYHQHSKALARILLQQLDGIKAYLNEHWFYCYMLCVRRYMWHFFRYWIVHFVFMVICVTINLGGLRTT